MFKLAVIADDLTGANDTAVQFSKGGLQSCVLLDTADDARFASENTDIVVIDTDSRSISGAEAYYRVTEACRFLQAAGGKAFYKKIDSTLRGNIGVEIAAAADVLQPDLVAIVPAFPGNGRITVGGYQLVQQVPLSRTEIAQDPKTPVRESHIPTLLEGQTKRPIGHIALGCVMAGKGAVQQEIKQQLAQGKSWIVFDAVNDEDLVAIGAAVKDSGKSLWVGSAGLAAVLPDLCGWERIPVITHTAIAGPVLAVVGSVSKVTRRQVAAMLQQPKTKLIEITAAELVSGTEEAVRNIVAAAVDLLAAGNDVIIASSVAEVLAGSQPSSSQRDGASDRIAATLGKIGARVMEQIPLAGVYLTGGDTAVNVCRATGAQGVDVLQEVAVGVPLGQLRGGRCAGLQVVTKAGAFGDEQIMITAAAALRGGN